MCVLSRGTGTEAEIQKKYTTHCRSGGEGSDRQGEGSGSCVGWLAFAVQHVAHTTLDATRKMRRHSQGKQFKELFIISGSQRARGGERWAGAAFPYSNCRTANDEAQFALPQTSPHPPPCSAGRKMLLSPRRKLIEENFFSISGRFCFFFLLILHKGGRRRLKWETGKRKEK